MKQTNPKNCSDKQLDKKIAELELQLSELDAQNFQLKNLIDNLPGDIYWKDKNGVWGGINKRCVQSLKEMGFIKQAIASEVIGKTDEQLFSLETANIYRQNDMDVMKKATELTCEEETHLVSGEKLTLLSTKRPLWDKDGNIIGVVGNTINITHLKKIETDLIVAKAAAEASNHAKGEFIANMSHDIRTPLTGITGLSQMIEDKATDPTQKNYAHLLVESSDVLLDMLNDILDVVSADNVNEKDLHEETFDVYQMIEEIIRLERPSTTKSGIDLIANIDKHIPSCLIADHTKIHRILLNLLGNAIKFTAKGCVTISLLLIKDEDTHVSVQFNVSDTGIGIPPEMQDKVFDRFFRVSPSYRGIYTGHGVGLHIAQSYTHLLGGEIELTSEPGLGTTFYFKLRLKKSDVPFMHMNLNNTQPVIQSEPTSSPSPSTTITSPCHTSTPITAVSNREPHLLLVEDNPIAMMVLNELVASSGYHITAAEDGQTAYDLATTQHFDLIITDLGLPNLTGFEFTEQFRKFETAHKRISVPILGLTAHADDNTKKACMAAGMNDVFSKPMSRDLFEQIKAVYLVKPPSSPPISTGSRESNAWMELPIAENPMFHLDGFSILDLEKVQPEFTDSLLEELLTMLLKEGFPQDLEELEDAHARQDWERITFIVHRGVGAYVTFGLYKLDHAGRYLCGYHRDKRTLLLEPLYQQFIRLIHESMQVLIEREQH